MEKRPRHHRRSIRLPRYDYTRPGAYVITIVAHERECLFGEILNGEMVLKPAGRIVEREWTRLAKRFPDVDLDAMVVMPNHVHGIILMVGEGEEVGSLGAGGTAEKTKLPESNSHRQELMMPDSESHRRAPTGESITPESGSRSRAPAHERFGKPVAGSLPTIVRSFKSAVTLEINRLRNTPGAPVWQRNYYEHVIRNEAEWDRFRRYIQNNPAQWAQDRENIP